MKITVLGAGAWGTAVGRLFALHGDDVVFYGLEKEPESINTEHVNKAFFPDVLLPLNASYTRDLDLALAGSDVLVFAIPSKAYRSVAKLVLEKLPSTKKVHVLSLAKGFDPETHERLSLVLREVLPETKRHEIVSLLGPSYAEEVIHDQWTCLSAISPDVTEARLFQKMLSSPSFRVYTNTDEVGSEIAAALKNVIAIAAGIVEGLGGGVNARAALVTRGNAEILRFGIQNGARMETFLGLSGIGDLMLTCNSMKSRNFSLGYEIGKANDARKVLENNSKTVEGVYTSKYVTEMAASMHVEMPICKAVYEVLFLGRKPSEKVDELMLRELKSE